MRISRHRRSHLISVTTAALLLGALPGSAAQALTPPGAGAAGHRLGAKPMDYDEVDCEGPAEGNVYEKPPQTGPPKTTPAKDPERKPAKEPAKDTPKGTAPAKDPEHKPAKEPERKPPKPPETAPAKPPEDPQQKPYEDWKNTRHKARAATSAAPRALPRKWPRNMPDRDEALRMLGELDVKPFDSRGYDRAFFGTSCWVRHGVDRCTTREIALKYHSVVPATLDGKCRVVGGKWHSEYDNRDMADPTHVDVDHIVSLRNAWGSGARTWSAEKREEFANDLSATPQLIVVSTWSNRRKGDKGPDKWLSLIHISCV